MMGASARAASALAERASLVRARWPTWWAYPTVVVLSIAMVALLMRLWQADLRIPFTYQAEALFNALLVKGILEHGWHLSNPWLGAPGGLDLRDLPMSDNNLHFAAIRLLGLATSDYALVMNLFFLLTFPLTALSALFVFRQFGLAAWPALCGSLLYTFLPFHFIRGQHHLFLVAYYVVPLAVMVALWIMVGTISWPEKGSRRWSWGRGHPKLIASALICVLIASSGVYYAFFACFFFLVAGAVAALRHRHARYLALPVALIAVIGAVMTAHFWPSILHVRQHGEPPTIRRSPLDADTYGLRISQLLLPPTGHRLDSVARFKDAVNAQLVSNEGDTASLGVIGGLGFLALVGWLALPRPERRRRETGAACRLVHDLSILNLSAVLLATVGGFGALLALLISSKIRAYNRMSIYIAFFSFFAVVVGLDAVYRRYCGRRGPRAAFRVGLAVLLVVSVFDQTSGRTIPNYQAIAAEYRSDAAFAHRLQAAMPPRAMIFQLPEIPFPEHPTVNRMDDYDHARGYLHAPHLRWSYGAMKGRAGEAWQTWVAAKAPPQLIETLAAAGFSGLYLNRDGYGDQGAKLSGEIGSALGQPPLSSDNGRLLFFDLRAFQREWRGQHTPAEWEAKQEAALHPLLVIWRDGCSDLEGPPENSFRWCSAAGAWRLINGARRSRQVALQMSFMSSNEANLWIEGPLLSEQLRIGPVPRALSRTISIPPGQHRLAFGCDAARVLARGDRRELVFRVINFSASPAEP
jgi:hypothetical protein